MTQPLVQINNVVKHYTRGKQVVEVLHGITLDIPKGDFVALMGPSGSGKTTLLNLIGGLDQPTRGEIIVDGQRIDRMSSSELSRWRARHVGFVFQFYNLLPVLTAERNVELPLLLTKMGGAERLKRANVALEIVGLKDRARHKPKELSGGQEQRVAIARAIVSEPAVLLADEPTGNLDSKNGEAVMELLDELHKGGATICMVTHDPRYAEFAGRKIFMFDGRVVDEETMHRLRKEEDARLMKRPGQAAPTSA